MTSSVGYQQICMDLWQAVSSRCNTCQLPSDQLLPARLPALETTLQLAAVSCWSLQDPKGQCEIFWSVSRLGELRKDELRLG